MRDNSPDQHSSRVIRLGDDKSERNSHPIGQIATDILVLANEVEVADEGLDSGHGAHDACEAGEVSQICSGRRDWDEGCSHCRGDGDVKGRRSDGHGDGSPRGHGGGGEGAGVVLIWADDTGVRTHEEDEDAWREPHGDEGADGLGVPLGARGRAEEETGAEVRGQGGGHVGCARGDTACDEVEGLFLADREVLGGGDAAEDELRGFSGCGKRGDVCDTAALDAEEGEHEGEDRGQDGHADVHVELEGADDTGHDEGDDEAETPFPGADLVFW